MKILISGVAGFIGVHSAARFLSEGHTVVGFDNLSRKGTQENLQWLKSLGGNFTFVKADIRQQSEMEQLLSEHRDCNAVLHLAAQVAVTTSVADPRLDFDTNALGTFNLLEACRIHAPSCAFLYSSTNKVYGEMTEVGVVEKNGRYSYQDLPNGVSEAACLDFHSPYGCSKGSADQYVRDYSRIFGLRGIVFRQSCIYGTRQFGVEDQGWISWFTIATALNKPLTLYGDGMQVRDVLWVDDLVDLYVLSIKNIDKTAGDVFNTGGGPKNTLSLLELIDQLEKLGGKPIRPAKADWRPGDQKVFVSDIGKAERQLGWVPKVSTREGLEKIWQWTDQHRDVINELLR
jgi:CDP-paratose 2-epimerase